MSCITRTYESTSSYGKVQVEKNWLIPTIKSLVTNPIGIWVGVLGAADGIGRHIRNAVDCGVNCSNQHFVENDLTQFNNVSNKITSGVIYKQADIVKYVKRKLSNGKHVSIIDADLCKGFSTVHKELFQLMVDYPNQTDILVLAMCLRDSNKEEILLWFDKECNRTNLKYLPKSYLGKGSKPGRPGGSPMLLVVVTK